MEIAPNKEGTAHDHPFDQCGIVIEGEIEMAVVRKETIETHGNLLHPGWNQAQLEDICLVS